LSAIKKGGDHMKTYDPILLNGLFNNNPSTEAKDNPFVKEDEKSSK